jgi:hypothetical protein
MVSCFLRVPPGVLQDVCWRTEAGDASRPHAVMTNGLISCEGNVVALSPSRTSLASLDWLPCPGRPSQFTFSRLAASRECTRVYSGAAPANRQPPAQHAFVPELTEANRTSVRLYLDPNDVHAELLFYDEYGQRDAQAEDGRYEPTHVDPNVGRGCMRPELHVSGTGRSGQASGSRVAALGSRLIGDVPENGRVTQRCSADIRWER